MVSHIDDDHIFGIMKLMADAGAATAVDSAAVKFDRFWFNSFEEIVGPMPSRRPGRSASGCISGIAASAAQNLPGVDNEHSQLIMQSVASGHHAGQQS